jgi:hypothetical protein
VLPVRGADNLTAVYEPIVQTMWDPSCYGDSFTLLLLLLLLLLLMAV